MKYISTIKCNGNVHSLFISISAVASLMIVSFNICILYFIKMFPSTIEKLKFEEIIQK